MLLQGYRGFRNKRRQHVVEQGVGRRQQVVVVEFAVDVSVDEVAADEEVVTKVVVGKCEQQIVEVEVVLRGLYK